MNSNHTFDPSKTPQQQTVDNSNFKPDTTELPLHFETYQEIAKQARKKITQAMQCIRGAVEQTDKMALRVAARLDRTNNPLDFIKASEDSPMEDPIARQKLAGSL